MNEYLIKYQVVRYGSYPSGLTSRVTDKEETKIIDDVKTAIEAVNQVEKAVREKIDNFPISSVPTSSFEINLIDIKKI